MKAILTGPILCGLVLSVGLAPVLAQPPPPRPGTPRANRSPGVRPGVQGADRPRAGGLRIDWRALNAELSLTPAQRQKVEALQSRTRQQMQRIRQSNAAPEAKRQQIQALRTRSISELNGILTAQQRVRARQILDRPRRPGSDAFGGRFFLQRVGRELNLTAAQQTKIEAIQRNFAAEAQKVRQGPGTLAQRREKLVGLEREREAKIRAVLTPAQRTKLESLRARSAAERESPEAMVRRMTTQLSLTADQQRRVRSLADRHAKTMESLRAQMRQPGANRAALRTKLQQERQAYMTSLRGILTPAQQQKLRQVRPVPGGAAAGRRDRAASR